MKLKFKNKTSEPQQINLIDGSAVRVFQYPDGETVIDSWNIYKEEIERAKIFFDVSSEPFSSGDITEKKVIPEDIYMNDVKTCEPEEEEKPKRTYTRKKREEDVRDESKNINTLNTEVL